MQSTSAAFQAAVSTSHVMAVTAEVWSGIGGNTLLGTLPVTGGEVTVDVTSAIRRRCKVTLADPLGTWTPSVSTDALTPYGNELRLYRGVTYNNGTTEMVPLGVFGLSVIEISDLAGVTLSLDGFDRSRKVARARIGSFYQSTPGTDAGTVIQALLTARVPLLTYNFAVTTYVPGPVILQPGDDPWSVASDIANAAGMDLYIDVAGVVTLTPTVDPATAPTVATFAEGSASTVTSVTRTLSDQMTYNDVYVTGENTGLTAPVSGRSADFSRTSPTYVGGPFGDVVELFSSPLLTTAAAAKAAASSRLARVTGLSEVVKLTCVPNPALDANDVIQVTRAASKTNARYSIESMTIPLTAKAPMTITTRRRSV